MKDETLFPEELKAVLQRGGTGISNTIYRRLIIALAKRQVKKYNLDDFLELGNEEDIFEPTEDEPSGPKRVDVINNDDDDELEPGARDADLDEDLEEDDYGIVLV
jgi:hypothetical protein